MPASPCSLREHVPALRHLARALTRDRETAEDLLQDTLCKALATPAPIDAAERPAAYLRQVMRNRWRDVCRGAARAPASAELPEVADPSGGGYDALAALQLWQALNELPEPMRRVVLLRAVEGRSTREVARALGISEGTVMSRLGRARAALRARLTGA